MPRTRRTADAVDAVAPARPRRSRARVAVAVAEPAVAAAAEAAAAPPPAPLLTLVESAAPSEQVAPVEPAEPLAASEVVSAIRQYLTFVVDGQEFGLEIHNVQEIRGYTSVTPLPNTPPHIKGLMNLRGAVIPIFDLRAWFGGGQAECTHTSVIVTVTVGERLVGLLVDAVSDVLDVEGHSLAPPPDLGPGVDTTLLAGLATVGERLVAVIKVDELVGGMMAA